MKEILARVDLPRLCLTGGEPLLQLEGVDRLVSAAIDRSLRVHVETNGTIDPTGMFPERKGALWVTVSPKPPDYIVAAGWQGRVDELKLVVDDTLDAATAERLAASHPEAVVSIQPCFGRTASEERLVFDELTLRHMERAVALVMAHPQWRLSLQTHKFLGIR